MNNNSADSRFLSRAVELSAKAIDGGTGGPFGAVVVRGGKIVGEGRNRVTCSNDPTAHAEVDAIRSACNHLETFTLSDCTLYSSCEPCPMCLGAIYWARLERLVYANTRDDAAAIDFDDAAIYGQIALPLAEQNLACTHLPSAAALNVFQQWAESEDKVEY